MDVVTITLRFVHIAAAAFWFGAAFATFGFLQPTIFKLGPDAQKVVAEMMGRRRFPIIVVWVTAFAVLAGLILYWRDSSGLQLSWITSPSGIGFTIGGVAGVVAFVLGPVLILPNFGKLGALGGRLAAERRPPSPDEAAEMSRAQKVLKTAGRVNLALLSVAIICMATARFW